MKEKNKEGVEFVFEQNPELAKIGTEEEYSEYIRTIFPESKIKEIVYHGSDEDFISKGESFKKEKIGSSFKGDRGFFGKGFYFTGIPEYKNNYGKIVYSAMLNIKNPFLMKNPSIRDIKNLHGKEINNDSVMVYNEHKSKQEKILFGKKQIIPETLEGNSEIMVVNSSQIHILGSNYDAEGFKNYIKNKSNKSSLENKVISGLFILTFLTGIALTTFNLTGNIIGTSGTAHKFIGIILFLLGISGFFIYKKLRS